MIQVALIGAHGKMGKIAEDALNLMNNFTIVALIKRGENLAEILSSTKPDIAIDLTSHESVSQNTWDIVKSGVRPIIGTSGLSQEETKKLITFCNEKKLGGIIAPNFSIAFAFINKMSKGLAQYYDDISIVEFHHAQKKDKPSGTARYTAEIVGIEESSIASVRSNSFLAKQQIYVSSESERIVIDHESFNRNSFLKGIQLCLKEVVKLDHLVVGLENILK